MFVREERGRIDNTTPDAVEAWLARDRIASGRAAVQLYTIARSPALASLLPVHTDRLEEIAARVSSLGIETMVVA